MWAAAYRAVDTGLAVAAGDGQPVVIRAVPLVYLPAEYFSVEFGGPLDLIGIYLKMYNARLWNAPMAGGVISKLGPISDQSRDRTSLNLTFYRLGEEIFKILKIMAT